jgi:hypothetical protein
LGVSRQGEFKNTIELFLQKFHVENFSQKIAQKDNVSFSSTFLFYRVFGCFSAMGVRQKNRPEIQNDFFSISFITCLGVSRRGKLKNTTIKQY